MHGTPKNQHDPSPVGFFFLAKEQSQNEKLQAKSAEAELADKRLQEAKIFLTEPFKPTKS